MIENYRTGSPWKTFMSNPEIPRMLEQLEAAGQHIAFGFPTAHD